MVDPKTLQCTGLIDLGRLGTADRYADLALMIANAEENWAAPDEAERAFAVLFNVLGIEAPDRERLAFYLRLDPLTWGSMPSDKWMRSTHWQHLPIIIRTIFTQR